jgi:hypothetical protein
VKAAYEALSVTPPPAVDEPLAPVRVVWRRDRPVTVKPGELLVVEWPAPGVVRFGVNGWQDAREVPLAPAHGVLGRRADLYRASLLRVPAAVRQVQLTFRDEAGDWLGYDFFVPVDAGFDIITPER